MPRFFDAAILSRMRSPVTSRSNWANERRTFNVSRPIGVVVLNCCVTETKLTFWASKFSMILAKSAIAHIRNRDSVPASDRMAKTSQPRSGSTNDLLRCLGGTLWFRTIASNRRSAMAIGLPGMEDDFRNGINTCCSCFSTGRHCRSFDSGKFTFSGSPFPLF